MAGNSFGTLTDIEIDGKTYKYHCLKTFEKASGKSLAKLPFSIKILLENMLRCEDGKIVMKEDALSVANWDAKAAPKDEVQFTPSRVILQDFTGVPCVADLAAMRNAIKELGGDPGKINPLQAVDLVIDHSVQVDKFGTPQALKENSDLEYQRNGERYQFLKWGQSALKNFRVVPPSTGIVHQVNLEYLAHLAMVGKRDGVEFVYPDTLVGTDSHTTMINGLGVLGWGVGGIEAEAAMLGQPSSMLVPNVVGFKLTGKLPQGATATDLVLTVTQMLRQMKVVGKFVEFYGPGLSALSLADRATIANMAPEYGATCGLFPIDEVTTEYLRLTGREDQAKRAEAYYKAQDLWYNPDKEAEYSETNTLDLGSVQPSLAGPARPQDRVVLPEVQESFKKFLATQKTDANKSVPTKMGGQDFDLKHGDVVIAAITSCTNTSNPSVMLAAGLVAKKAVEKGLMVKPWVKTSLAPGSKVVTDYLVESGLMQDLEKLKFNVVGYGCTTCIGNSGPLPDAISKSVSDGGLSVASVLSGNRNFEGRVNNQVRANYLASPPLVVAFALAGTLCLNMDTDPIGTGSDGKPVFLKDIWPTNDEVQAVVNKHVTSGQFKRSYDDVFSGDSQWNNVQAPTGELFDWQDSSTYIKEPPFFKGMKKTVDPVADIKGARVLALMADSVTTDHISPAGSFAPDTPAGIYLKDRGVAQKDFNSYGSRRGNHEVMMRGTFANVRIRNQIVPGVEGGFTKHMPSGTQMTIFDASEKYKSEGVPTIVVAGKEYGTGSSRDWAAKGPNLLGVRAVIAESFERIHRSNLVGMGVLPLQFVDGESAKSHGLTGEETFDIANINDLKPRQNIEVSVNKADGSTINLKTLCRIDTPNEVEYFKNGGILQYVLRQMMN